MNALIKSAQTGTGHRQGGRAGRLARREAEKTRAAQPVARP
nr:hypothetical protein [uncultured Janthinobacterium sp.]